MFMTREKSRGDTGRTMDGRREGREIRRGVGRKGENKGTDGEKEDRKKENEERRTG